MKRPASENAGRLARHRLTALLCSNPLGSPLVSANEAKGLPGRVSVGLAVGGVCSRHGPPNHFGSIGRSYSMRREYTTRR